MGVAGILEWVMGLADRLHGCSYIYLCKLLHGLLPATCYTVINSFTLKCDALSEVQTNSCHQPSQGTLVFTDQDSNEPCGPAQTILGFAGGKGVGGATWLSTYRRPVFSSWLNLSVGSLPAGNFWRVLGFLQLYVD